MDLMDELIRPLTRDEIAFRRQARVWRAYNEGDCTMNKRDEALKPYRDTLKAERTD